MKAILTLTYLAALAASAALSPREPNPLLCPEPEGIYDKCDSVYSFVRCNGHDTMLVVDCQRGSTTYCRIVDGKGRCDASTPPDLGSGYPTQHINENGTLPCTAP